MNLGLISPHLSSLYKGDKERCGFVLTNGDIVEVPNICGEPANGFLVAPEDVIKYGDDCIMTWHTHPDATANLSFGDRETFLNWEQLHHAIIGSDGVRVYKVENGEVLCVSK